MLRPVMLPVLRSVFDGGVGGSDPLLTAVRKLFASGEQGALYYFTEDFAGLYQDAAGTLPVSAVGQPVGLMLDKSGRGNHASQPTTTARPLLQRDANGKLHLAFDGVDDRLSTGAFAANTAAFTSTFAFRPNVTTPEGTVFLFGNDDNNSAGSAVFRHTVMASPRTRDGVTTHLVNAPSAFTTTAAAVISTRHDCGGTNSAAEITAPVTMATTTATSTVFGTWPLCLGARRTATFLNGALYGFALVGSRVDSTGTANLRALFARQSGITGVPA